MKRGRRAIVLGSLALLGIVIIVLISDEPLVVQENAINQNEIRTSVDDKNVDFENEISEKSDKIEDPSGLSDSTGTQAAPADDMKKPIKAVPSERHLLLDNVVRPKHRNPKTLNSRANFKAAKTNVTAKRASKTKILDNIIPGKKGGARGDDIEEDTTSIPPDAQAFPLRNEKKKQVMGVSAESQRYSDDESPKKQGKSKAMNLTEKHNASKLNKTARKAVETIIDVSKKGLVNDDIGTSIMENIDIITEDNEDVIKSVSQKGCRRLPDALLIGFEKCGTETLLTFLDIHPHLKVSEHYFTFFNQNNLKSLRRYLQQKDVRCAGPGVLKVSKMAVEDGGWPKKAFKYKPDLKLLAIVREPVERLFSHFIHWKKVKGNNRNQTPSQISSEFKNLVDKFLAAKHSMHLRIHQSLYAKELVRWLQYYKLEQIHIIDGENFIKHPADELNEVAAFLGLNRYFDMKKHFIFNTDKKFYCLKQQGCMPSSKGREHPKMDKQTRQKLQTFFQSHNHAFFDLIGRKFPWKYDLNTTS